MVGKLGYLKETPSQTAGPYVHIGLIPHQAGFDIFERPFGNVMTERNTPGERIRIEGQVLDGLGAPCHDVLLEAWQANAAGRYNHPADRQRRPSVPASEAGAAPEPTSPPVYTNLKLLSSRSGDWSPRLQADGPARQHLAGGPRHKHRARHSNVFRGRDSFE
jgi:hypothetical protein